MCKHDNKLNHATPKLTSNADDRASAHLSSNSFPEEGMEKTLIFVLFYCKTDFQFLRNQKKTTNKQINYIRPAIHKNKEL